MANIFIGANPANTILAPAPLAAEKYICGLFIDGADCAFAKIENFH